MSNVAILTMKDLNRIQSIAYKGKKYAEKQESNIYDQQRSNAKSQLAEINESNRHQTHIPTLKTNSKSSLSKKANKTQKPPMIFKPENKNKKQRITPKSVVNNRNKNNKLSKIPLRKIEDSNESPIKKSSKSKEKEAKSTFSEHKNQIEEEGEFSAPQSEEINSEKFIRDEQTETVKTNDAKYDNINNKNDAEYKKAVNELETHKKYLSEIELLNTIPFNKTELCKVNCNDESEVVISKCRSNMHKLQNQIDSLRERRKKELAFFHEQSIELQRSYRNENGKKLIESDDEVINQLKNKL